MIITSENTLLMIRDYKIEKITEEKKKRHLFKPTTLVTEENEYLTEIDIMGYNIKLEYWGTYSTDTTIRYMFDNYDFSSMRDNYIRKIKTPLEKLGIDFIIKEKTITK
jgi:hypothetical protein